MTLSGTLDANWHNKHVNDPTTEKYNYDDTLVGEDDVFMVSVNGIVVTFAIR
jgi:hypothetical protein